MSNITRIYKIINKRVLAISLTLIFAFGAVAVPAFAERDLGTVNDELKDAKDQYETLKKQEDDLKNKIKNLEANIKQTESAIKDTDAQITQYNSKIESLADEVAKMEKIVDDQNSDLNRRLRAMYESGDQSIISVLLGSESIVDFLANLDMVKKIHKSDVELLDELSRLLDDVEAKKAEAENIEQLLEVQKNEQINRKASLEVDKVELASLQDKVHELKLDAMEDLVALQAESNRIQQELANRNSGFDYGGGVLSWPVQGRITSEYGPRTGVGYGNFHMGIDIAVPMGTPIHAAADGVVISAKWNNSYGNVIMVDHGSNIVTLYAHNSGFAVSAGQAVVRGQVIAYAGSTGDSTGPHCHFEVRVNGQHQNPRAWL